MEPISEFLPFPRLPHELRDKIWTFTLPGPRIIAAILKSNAKHWTYTTNTKNPSVLLVNHEARRVATRKLTVVLKSVIENTNRPSRILIDPAVDTIYLPGPRTINAIPDLLTPGRSIRFLALDLEDTIAPPELHWYVERPYGKAHLAYCLGLDTLTLVMHKYPCSVETR